MSDTVKLIIEIPKEDFKKLVNPYQHNEIWCNRLKRMVMNGIPLDDVISKIEKLNPVDYGSMFSYESHNGARDMQRDVLQILDSIESEEV